MTRLLDLLQPRVELGRGLIDRRFGHMHQRLIPDLIQLDQLDLANTTVGTGTQTELDTELGAPALWLDDGDAKFGTGDTWLANGGVSAGSMQFSGINFAMPDGTVGIRG